MKMLTETETGGLQAALQDIHLPSTAAIYQVQGVPTVFRRDATAAGSESDGRWLHLPFDLLASIKRDLTVKGTNQIPSHIATRPIEADDLDIYPVIISGEIRAVIATDRDTPFAPDGNIGVNLLENLSDRYHQTSADGSLVTKEFLERLFDRDRSLDEFHRSMLNLMTSQWPQALGAIYFEQESVYRLRLAVGDIHLSDRLEGTLTQQRCKDWTEAVRTKRYFTHADIMPDFPVLMDQAPNYVFVHRGIQSDRTEYLVALLMSGDIGAEQVRAVMQIARMTGYLHEAQFSTTAETVSLYGCLRELPTSNGKFRRLLRQVFNVVGRQINLSRLVVGDVGGSATVLTGRGGKGLTFGSEPSPPIPPGVLSLLTTEEPVLVDEVSADSRFESAAKRYRVDQVVSELVLSTGHVDGVQGYIAYGSRLAGDHLDRHRPFFVAVATFVRLARQLMATYQQDTLISPKSHREPDPMARDRLDIIAKLAGGYFHDIMEYLSVVVGQNELIENEPADCSAVEKGAIKVRKAADQIADYLDKLRSICLLTTDQLGRRLSVGQFLKDLPSIVHGYARQIRDSKNVVLTMDTQHLGDTDFEITWQELYDWVLPLVLGIMDEAICSGKLTVRTESVDESPSMVFEFSTDIIGHTSPGELIARIYAHWSGELITENQGSIEYRRMTLHFSTGVKDSCCVRIEPREMAGASHTKTSSAADSGEGISG